jgi:hypothetical protein
MIEFGLVLSSTLEFKTAGRFSNSLAMCCRSSRELSKSERGLILLDVIFFNLELLGS